MQAISTDDYVSGQANALGRTRNTATIIPQSYLDERVNQMGGRSRFAVPGSGTKPVQAQSGNPLSAMAGGYNLTQMQPYNAQVNKPAKEMTYSDWAKYFAQQGPSSGWDKDTWDLFYYLNTPGASATSGAGADDPRWNPAQSSIFQYDEITKMPGINIYPTYLNSRGESRIPTTMGGYPSSGVVSDYAQWQYNTGIPSAAYGNIRDKYEQAAQQALAMLATNNTGYQAVDPAMMTLQAQARNAATRTDAVGNTYVDESLYNRILEKSLPVRHSPQSMSIQQVADEYARINSPYGLYISPEVSADYADSVAWVNRYFPKDAENIVFGTGQRQYETLPKVPFAQSAIHK